MPTLPIVLLPGASGHSRVWSAVMRHLRAPARAFDYPGLATAHNEPDLRSIDDLYRWWVAHLPERFDLGTMSMGATLGIRFCLEQPARVRRLCLVAPTGGLGVVALGGADWRPGWKAPRADWPRWFIDDLVDYRARLQELPQPVQLIFGDADPLSPPAVGERLAPLFRAASQRVIAGATHDLLAEQPEPVAALLNAHFRDVSVG